MIPFFLSDVAILTIPIIYCVSFLVSLMYNGSVLIGFNTYININSRFSYWRRIVISLLLYMPTHVLHVYKNPIEWC